MSSAPRVPFTRPFYGATDGKPATTGTDVQAVKRALSRAGYLPWRVFDTVYNAKTVAAVKKFQADKKLMATGNYGQPTHVALVNTHREGGTEHEWAFDTIAVQMMRQWTVPPPVHTKRDLVVDLALWTVDIRDSITYTQARPIWPIEHKIKPPQSPRWLDCSGHYKYVLLDAINLDVDGLRMYGNTDTMYAHGKAVPIPQVRPGDAIFYHGHVVLVVSNNRGDIKVVSNGSNPGPLVLPFNYRDDYIGARDYIGD